jgi:hypothetical protein
MLFAISVSDLIFVLVFKAALIVRLPIPSSDPVR